MRLAEVESLLDGYRAQLEAAGTFSSTDEALYDAYKQRIAERRFTLRNDAARAEAASFGGPGLTGELGESDVGKLKYLGLGGGLAGLGQAGGGLAKTQAIVESRAEDVLGERVGRFASRSAHLFPVAAVAGLFADDKPDVGVEAEQKPAYELGKFVEDWTARVGSGGDAMTQQSLPFQVTAGVGQMLPAALSGPAAPFVGAMTAGAGQLADSYDTARERGYAPDKAYGIATRVATEAAALEAVGLRKLLGPLKGVTAQGKIALQRGLGVGIQAGQEGFTRAHENIETGQPWAEGVGRESLVGGVAALPLAVLGLKGDVNLELERRAVETEKAEAEEAQAEVAGRLEEFSGAVKTHLYDPDVTGMMPSRLNLEKVNAVLAGLNEVIDNPESSEADLDFAYGARDIVQAEAMASAPQLERDAADAAAREAAGRVTPEERIDSLRQQAESLPQNATLQPGAPVTAAQAKKILAAQINALGPRGEPLQPSSETQEQLVDRLREQAAASPPNALLASAAEAVRKPVAAQPVEAPAESTAVTIVPDMPEALEDIEVAAPAVVPALTPMSPVPAAVAPTPPAPPPSPASVAKPGARVQVVAAPGARRGFTGAFVVATPDGVVVEDQFGIERTVPFEAVTFEQDEEPLASMAVSRRGGKLTAGMGFDKRAVQTLGANLYQGRQSTIITKELVQNALDAIIGVEGGAVTTEIDSADGTVKVRDTGRGMTLQQATKAFMNIGASHKEDGAIGGFGIAKLAIFPRAENIYVRTVAKVRGGRKHVVILAGSGQDWVNRKLAVSTGEAADQGERTGTVVEIALNEGDFDFWGTKGWVGDFVKTSRLGGVAKFYLNGEEVTGSLIDEGGGEIEGLPEVVVQAPGAELRISPAERGLYETNYVTTSILNRGMPQFTGGVSINHKLLLPSQLIVNVVPTVDVTDQLYPFTSSRESLKVEVKRVLEAYVKYELAGAASRAERDAMVAAYDKRAPMAASRRGMVVFDTTNKLPQEFVQRVAENAALAKLSDALALASDPMREAIRKSIPSADVGSRSEFLGVGLGVGYLGVNIRGKSVEGAEMPDMMLYNPFISLREALTSRDPREWVAQQAGATLVHELSHDLDRGHEEPFSTVFTRASGATAAMQADLAESLQALLSNEAAWGELLALKEEYDVHTAAVTKNDDLFRKIGDTSESRHGNGSDAGRAEGGRVGGPRPASGVQRGREGGLGGGLQTAPTRGDHGERVARQRRGGPEPKLSVVDEDVDELRDREYATRVALTEVASVPSLGKARLYDLIPAAQGKYIARYIENGVLREKLVTREEVTAPQDRLVAYETARQERQFFERSSNRAAARRKLSEHLNVKLSTVDVDEGEPAQRASEPAAPDTPAFKAWFRGSKVVDANGKPLVAYHFSSSAGFNAFKPWSHFGTKKAAQDRDYHTTSGLYATRESPGSYAAYLSVKNPLRLSDKEANYGYSTVADFAAHPAGGNLTPGHPALVARFVEVFDSYSGGFGGADLKLASAARSFSGASDVLRAAARRVGRTDYVQLDEAERAAATDVLNALGFDGVAYENAAEDKGSTAYIAFRPEQIKSATGNRGTYAVHDPDMRMSLGEPVPGLTLHPEAANRIADALVKALKIPRSSIRWVETVGEDIEPEVLAKAAAKHPPLAKGKTRKKAVGATINGVIELSLARDFSQASKTAFHEAIHWAKQAGVISVQDWLHLDQSHAAFALANKMSVEEAVADSFADYVVRRGGIEFEPRAKTIFERLLNFLRNMRQALEQHGIHVVTDILSPYTRREDIFTRLATGELAEQAEQEGRLHEPGEGVALSLKEGDNLTMRFRQGGKALDWRITAAHANGSVEVTRHSESQNKDQTRTFTADDIARYAVDEGEPKRDTSSDALDLSRFLVGGKAASKNLGAAEGPLRRAVAKVGWLDSAAHEIAKTGPVGQDFVYRTIKAKVSQHVHMHDLHAALAKAAEVARKKYGRAPGDGMFNKEMRYLQYVVSGRDIDAEIKKFADMARKAVGADRKAAYDQQVNFLRQVKSAIGGNPRSLFDATGYSVKDHRQPADKGGDHLKTPREVHFKDGLVLKKSPTGPMARWAPLIEAYREWDDRMKTEADKAGGMFMAGWIPNHVSHRLTPQARQQLRKRGAAHDLIVAALSEKIQAEKKVTPDEATRLAEEALLGDLSPIRTDLLRLKEGSLEKHRGDIYLPSMIDWSSNAAAEYAWGGGTVIGQFSQFAKIDKSGERTHSTSASKGMSDSVAAVAREARNADFSNYAEAFLRRHALWWNPGMIEDNAWRKAWANLAKFNVGTKLAGPRTHLQNVYTPAMFSAFYGPRFIRGALLALSPTFRAKAASAGVGQEAKFYETEWQDVATGDGIISRAADAIAHAGTRFAPIPSVRIGGVRTPALTFNSGQVVSELGTSAGFWNIAHDALATLSPGVKTQRHDGLWKRGLGLTNLWSNPDHARRWLREAIYMPDSEIDAAIKRGHFSDEQGEVIMWRGAESSAGTASPNNLPLWALGDLARPFRTFRTFMLGNMVKLNRHVIREAFPETGKRNFRPLVNFLVMGGAAGMAYGELEDWLAEHLHLMPRRERWSKYYDTASKRAVARWVEGYTRMGAFTALTDPADLTSADVWSANFATLAELTRLVDLGIKRSPDVQGIGRLAWDSVRRQVVLINTASRMYGDVMAKDGEFDSLSKRARGAARLYLQSTSDSPLDRVPFIEHAGAPESYSNPFRPEAEAVHAAIRRGDVPLAQDRAEKMIEAMVKSEYMDDMRRDEMDADEAFKKAAGRVQSMLMSRAPLGAITSALDPESDDAQEKFSRFEEWLEKSNPGLAPRLMDAHDAYSAQVDAVMSAFTE